MLELEHVLLISEMQKEKVFWAHKHCGEILFETLTMGNFNIMGMWISSE